MSAAIRQIQDNNPGQDRDQALYQLAYVSESRLTGAPADIVAAVGAIATVAQRNNASLGVTGALLFKDDCFAQVLEGSEADVGTLMRRIEADPRHRSVTVLEQGTVAMRSFPSWSMAQLQPRGDFDWTLLDRMMSGAERMGRQRARSLVSMMQYCLIAR